MFKPVKVKSDAQFTVNFVDKKIFIKRLLKSFGILLLILYSGEFLNEIPPLMNMDFFIMSIIVAVFYIIKMVFEVWAYFKNKDNSFVFTSQEIKIVHGEKTTNIKSPRIFFCWWQGILVKASGISILIPMKYINDNKQFREIFEDTIPWLGRYIKKTWDFFYSLIIALVLAMHIRVYIAEPYFIPTSSMEDTLLVGDHIVALKFTYGQKILVLYKILPDSLKKYARIPGLYKIKRGDIVIFKPPHEKDKDYIKRCIGLPGDHYAFIDNAVYINGVKLKEPYVKGKTFFGYTGEEKIPAEGVVPPHKYMMLGDNRENSSDSREWGFANEMDIKGSAWFIFFTGEIVHVNEPYEVGGDGINLGGITLFKHSYLKNINGVPIRKVGYFERVGRHYFTYDHSYADKKKKNKK